MPTRSARMRKPPAARIWRASCWSLLEVLRALDEDVGDAEAVVEDERRVVAAGADLLGPDLARDVDEDAAAVALAVDVAGAVQHLLEVLQRERHRRVAGRRVLADRGVDRARVLVLDARRGDTSGRQGSSGEKRCGEDTLLPPVPRLLRAGARRTGEREVYGRYRPTGVVAGTAAIESPRWPRRSPFSPRRAAPGRPRWCARSPTSSSGSGIDVLAIDADPQGNLSDYFDTAHDASPTLGDVLQGQARAADAVHGSVIPANLALARGRAGAGGQDRPRGDPAPGADGPQAPEGSDPDRLPAHPRAC